MTVRAPSQRMCVGCRQKDERGALLRFVVAGDPPQVVPDVSRRSDGRGASVHPLRRCLDALKVEFETDADALALWAHGQYGRRLAGLLTAAHRGGRAVIGTERVRDAIAAKRAVLLVVAGDAADNRDELMRSVERLGGQCLVYGDRASLGALFGREMVAVLAITDRELAVEVKTAAECAAAITGAGSAHDSGVSAPQGRPKPGAGGPARSRGASGPRAADATAARRARTKREVS
jgi:ribosomal protein L7Ae-like RNA K-turn-binding protein